MKFFKPFLAISFLIITSCNIFETGDSLDVTLDYEVEGLSKEVDLGNILSLSTFNKSINNGYNSLVDLSSDLDSMGLGIGEDYIDSFDYSWFGSYDGESIDNNSTYISISGENYSYSTSGGLLIVRDAYYSILSSTKIFDQDITGLNLYGDKLIIYTQGIENNLKIITLVDGRINSTEVYSIKGNIESLSIDSGFVTILTSSSLDYSELLDDLFIQPMAFSDDPVTDEDRSRAEDNLTINIPSWRNKIIQDLFIHDGVTDLDLLNNSFRLYSDVNEGHSLTYLKVVGFSLDGGYSSHSTAGVFIEEWDGKFFLDDNSLVLISNRYSNLNPIYKFSILDGSVSPSASYLLEGYIYQGYSIEYTDGYLTIQLSSGSWDTLSIEQLTLNSDLEEISRISYGETVK